MTLCTTKFSLDLCAHAGVETHCLSLAWLGVGSASSGTLWALSRSKGALRPWRRPGGAPPPKARPPARAAPLPTTLRVLAVPPPRREACHAGRLTLSGLVRGRLRVWQVGGARVLCVPCGLRFAHLIPVVSSLLTLRAVLTFAAMLLFSCHVGIRSFSFGAPRYDWVQGCLAPGLRCMCDVTTKSKKLNIGCKNFP